MLHKVGPSLFCWCYLGFFASLAWLFSCLKMNFLNKITGVVANILVRVTIIVSWFVLNVLLHKAFMFFLGQPQHDRLFRGYKRLGKTVGSALLFFGNIGLYYYSEKSVACMLTFLFLALHCLCALFCIQPYTDFGVLEFLLGASLNQGLCLFGIHSYSFWFVLIACIVMVGLRYCLEPTNKSKFEVKLDSNLTLPVQLEIGSSLALPPVQSGFKWDQMQVWQFLQFNYARIFFRNSYRWFNYASIYKKKEGHEDDHHGPIPRLSNPAISPNNSFVSLSLSRFPLKPRSSHHHFSLSDTTSKIGKMATSNTMVF